MATSALPPEAAQSRHPWPALGRFVATDAGVMVRRRVLGDRGALGDIRVATARDVRLLRNTKRRNPRSIAKRRRRKSRKSTSTKSSKARLTIYAVPPFPWHPPRYRQWRRPLDLPFHPPSDPHPVLAKLPSLSLVLRHCDVLPLRKAQRIRATPRDVSFCCNSKPFRNNP